MQERWIAREIEATGGYDDARRRADILVMGDLRTDSARRYVVMEDVDGIAAIISECHLRPEGVSARQIAEEIAQWMKDRLADDFGRDRGDDGMTEFDPDWTVHPGETLREWREENGLGVKAAATTCGRMDPVVFSAVESGKRRITKTIAAQLEHGTCIPARLWLRLEKRFREDLKAGRTWTR